MKKIVPLFLLLFAFLSNCKKDLVTATVHNLPEYSPFNFPVDVINQGVPGNTAGMLLARVNSIINEKPPLVVIMIGTNDVIRGQSTLSALKDNLSKVIDSLQHTGSAVMLLTPPPLKKPEAASYSYPYSVACSTIKGLAVTKNCYFVDVFNDLAQAITPQNSHIFYASDGIHLSAVGYYDVAKYVYICMVNKRILVNKVVCFGDSLTYGIYVQGAGTSEGDTYPAELKRDLNGENN